MEASVLREPGSNAATLMKDPRASFLRLQSDERLVALTRRGNEAAFETLISRYRARLLAFCRHMVGSTEDAEDILQEVFVSAYRAMLADDRELNVRPWLYRIARNRSLNHLRRPRPTGVDSMDVFEGGAAVATADRVHDKLDLEDLVEDVKKLPETQRTALMLREMGDLSYDQIAEAMDTSIPSVKSLLVRARVSLAEAAESRRLSCDEVRMELGAVAEGLQKLSSPARRHVADCDRCRAFKKELSITNRKLTVLAPVGLFVLLKSVVALKVFGTTVAGGSSAAGGSAAGGIGAATGASGAAAGGGAAAGAAAATGGGAAAGVSAGLGAVAAKVGTGLVAAALVTGGVAQVAKHEVNTSKITQHTTATKPATDPSSTGGVAPGAVADSAAPAEPTGATGSTGDEQKTDEPSTTPVAVAPTESTGTTDKPEVVDEETTSVKLPSSISEPSSSIGGGSSGETPGLPTGENTPPPPSGAGSTPATPPATGSTGASDASLPDPAL